MARGIRGVVFAGCLLAASVPAWAQEARPASDVLKLVPAGSMAFVVVNDVKSAVGKVDAFINEVGLNAVLPAPSVLDLLKQALKLPQDMTFEGGAAGVLLDPQQYGMDLLGLFSGKAPEKPVPPPVVLIVKGDDPAKLFTGWEAGKEGDAQKFTKAGQTVYAALVGGHVVTGPSLKAVQAVVASKKSVLDQLSALDKDFLARNDVAVWVDMKMTGPLLDVFLSVMKMQRKADQQKDRRIFVPAAEMGDAMLQALEGSRETLKQIASLTLGLRVDKTGVVAEGQVSFQPDSAMGKVVAAWKPVKTPLLHRLPAMPYLLVIGGGNDLKPPRELREKELDAAFALPPYDQLSEENRAKLKQLSLGLQDEIGEVQLYVGGITTGPGKVGASIVLGCQSADKVKEMLQSGVALAGEVIKTVKDEPFKSLSVKYLKGVETVGDAKVDAISFDHPKLADMTEKSRGQLKAILGEDKLRLLIAQPSEKMLVLTFGGGTTFLAEAAKVAQAGSGTLEKDPGIVKATQALPKNKIAFGAFHVGNLLPLVKSIAGALGETPPPIELSAPTPFAMSVSVENPGVSMAVYFPADSIREIVKLVLSFTLRAMPGAGGEDL